MQHIPEIDMKIVGNRAFMLNSEWPKTINVARPLVEAIQPPVGIALGRRGSLFIETANGTARYQRTGDIDGGWSYELRDFTKIIPIAPDPPPEPTSVPVVPQETASG